MPRKVRCRRPNLYSVKLELGLKPVVIINKIDKPARRVHEVEDELADLFFGARDS